MQLTQQGIYLGRSTGLIPTDDTKTYSLQSTLDETRYYLLSTLHQSPKVRSVGLNVFLDGVHHVDDATKKVVFRKTTDTFLTYGTKTTFYDPVDGDFQAQTLACGYSNNGRFHALVGCHTDVGVSGGDVEIRYMYSDDDGTTVSSPVVIPFPATSMLVGVVHDKIIDLGNGVMLAPAYFSADADDITQSERWVLRTTDSGENWSWVLVEAATSAFINEGSLLAVTNNIVYMMCRNDATLQFTCYKTTDAGATWTTLGGFGTTVSKSSADPCALRKFRADNGKWYAVMYFSNRGADELYAIYGRLDNGVDGGLGLFNLATLTLLRTDPVNYLHYGDFIHYNGNMNARGAWPREVSAVANEDNELIYFENLTTQYDTVFALIDPVTIYDKLYATMGIYDVRGLVSNTNNDWGVVNGSDQITTWKSIRPGPLSQDFTATAGGIVLSSGNVDMDGTKALTHGTAAYWKPLHYSSSGVADVNNTLYVVINFSDSANYGIFGNNAASSGNIGYCMYRTSANDGWNLLISKGTAGFIIQFLHASVLTASTLMVLCAEVDLSQASNDDKVKVYINNVLQSTTVTAYNASISSSNPTYNAQIGAVGNNSQIGVIRYRQLIVQNHVDLPSVRSNMNLALMGINGIS